MPTVSLYLVVHSHKYGETIYTVSHYRTPTDEEIAHAINSRVVDEPIELDREYECLTIYRLDEVFDDIYPINMKE